MVITRMRSTAVKKSNSGGDPILRGFEVLGETDASEVDVLGRSVLSRMPICWKKPPANSTGWGLRPFEIHTIRVPVQ